MRLAALTGSDEYRSRASETIRLVGELAGRHPTAFGHALAAIDLESTGIDEVVVVGDRPDLVEAVRTRYLPNAVLAWGEPYESPLWADRADGMAYVCRDFTCRLPVDTVEGLAAQLS